MKPKLIGTFVPLSALKLKEAQDTGTINAGIAFLDWLKTSGQNAWQMLPLNETPLEEGSSIKHIMSPYKSYGVGLDPKYLSNKLPRNATNSQEQDNFIDENRDWIADYATFCVLRDYYKTDDWTKWEDQYRSREPVAMEYFRNSHIPEIQKYIECQRQLHFQFNILKSKAAKLGIKLIGDLPFYISHRSPLVWANQNLFDLDKNGKMRHSTGIPADKKRKSIRQFWGHPPYLWRSKKQYPGIVTLWRNRIKHMSQQFDWIRIDHADGFFNCGTLNLSNTGRDRFVIGPGAKTLREIMDYCKEIKLGVYLENVGKNIKKLNREIFHSGYYQVQLWIYELYKESKLKIMANNPQAPKYKDRSFVFSTTHDTKTLIDFVEKLSVRPRSNLSRKAGITKHVNVREYCKKIIAAITNSNAYGVIIPIQDRLLTRERINTPGTEKQIGDDNWRFVMDTPVEELPFLDRSTGTI